MMVAAQPAGRRQPIHDLGLRNQVGGGDQPGAQDGSSKFRSDVERTIIDSKCGFPDGLIEGRVGVADAGNVFG